MGDEAGALILDGSIGEGADEYLPYLINQVQTRRMRDLAQSLEVLGLTMSHWRVIGVCQRLGGALMSELAEFTTVDRTTLTRTVDQLVEMQLAERSNLPEDRRQVRVDLTERAKALYTASFGSLVAHNRRLLSGFTPEEARTLRSLLQRLLANMIEDEDLFRQILHYRR